MTERLTDEALTKAEKLARAMDQVISGGRAFNRQLAAQVRDELRRSDRRATPADEARGSGCEWCVDGVQADGETPCPCATPADDLRAAATEVARLWGNGCKDHSWRQHFDGAVDRLAALSQNGGAA